MILTPDRRSTERRVRSKIPEAIDRMGARRAEERRDAGRPFKTLFVQSSVAPLPVLHRASLSLGGAKWVTEHPPEESEVTLHLQLAEMPKPAVVAARIERRRALKNGKTELYAAFLDLDVKTELTLARFLETRARLSAAVE